MKRIDRFIAMMLLTPAFLLTTTSPLHAGNSYVSDTGNILAIGNSSIEITFSKSDGRLWGIHHKRLNTELLTIKNGWWAPFQLTYFYNDKNVYTGGWSCSKWSYQSNLVPGGAVLSIQWSGFSVEDTTIDAQFEIQIEVDDNSQLSTWKCWFTDHSNLNLVGVDFPVVSGIGQISQEGEEDSLVFPTWSGLLFHDPIHNLLPNRGWGWEMVYPSSLSNMQFMAYYGNSPQAGLYFALYDPDSHSKFIDFSKPGDSVADYLFLHVRHFPELNQHDFQLTYPIVIGVFEGDWYDAAQIYRRWTLQQSWAQSGKIYDRAPGSSPLESLGLIQWIYTYPECIPPSVNPFSVVPEIAADTARFIGSPVAMSWIGWEKFGWYSQYPDVFPPKEGWDSFRSTIQALHGSGNKVLLIPSAASYSSLATSWEEASPWACRDRSNQLFTSSPIFECGIHYVLNIMCPNTQYWQNKLTGLLTPLSDAGADIIQLDGFPASGPQFCLASTHGHPLGGGTWWAQAYADFFSGFKSVAKQNNPSLLFSSEGMAERYLGLLELSWNPFTTGISSDTFTSVVLDPSKVEKIPLWHTVFHDYGFIQSGIGFVSHNAYYDYRSYYLRGYGLGLVWGEIPCIWYANAKLSELSEKGELEMADYVRRIVKARQGYARSYLVYGRLLRPLSLNVPLYRINGAKAIPYTLANVSPFDSPAILASLWESPKGIRAVILTNISENSVAFALPLKEAQLELKPNMAAWITQTKNGQRSSPTQTLRLPQILDLQLDPRDILLVEIEPLMRDLFSRNPAQLRKRTVP